MTLSIRPAGLADLPAMTDLLLAGAERRRTLDPGLWPLASEARATIEAATRAGLAPDAAPGQVWLLAEYEGCAVGIGHGMIAPPPPIYDIKTLPGLLLDDCEVAPGAPADTADALLAAMETALQAAGAGSLIASCPTAGAWRGRCAAAGYEAVTTYLSKTGLTERPPTRDVRPAGPDDVAGIVKLSAVHRRTLAGLSPRFWPAHPDADARFQRWMAFSLTLGDRDMFVADRKGETAGYVIAQPITALHVPAGHALRGSGVIDDFYAGDFADVARSDDCGDIGRALLAAAESAFRRRGVETALAVCPTSWTSKLALLEQEGYRAAKLWMLKRA